MAAQNIDRKRYLWVRCAAVLLLLVSVVNLVVLPPARVAAQGCLPFSSIEVLATPSEGFPLNWWAVDPADLGFTVDDDYWSGGGLGVNYTFDPPIVSYDLSVNDYTVVITESTLDSESVLARWAEDLTSAGSQSGMTASGLTFYDYENGAIERWQVISIYGPFEGMFCPDGALPTPATPTPTPTSVPTQTPLIGTPTPQCGLYQLGPLPVTGITYTNESPYAQSIWSAHTGSPGGEWFDQRVVVNGTDVVPFYPDDPNLANPPFWLEPGESAFVDSELGDIAALPFYVCSFVNVTPTPQGTPVPECVFIPVGVDVSVNQNFASGRYRWSSYNGVVAVG